MGKVCRICDRKFFIRASFETHANDIKFYQDQTQKVEAELDIQDNLHADLLEQARLVRKMTSDEEKRNNNLYLATKDKLEDLRESETELKRLSDSFTQKVKMRKKAVH